MTSDRYYGALFPQSPYRELPVAIGPYRYRWLRKNTPPACTTVLDFYQRTWQQAALGRTMLSRSLAVPRSVLTWLRSAMREHRAHSAAAQREYGRSKSGQWRDMVMVFTRTGVTPPEYYSGHLARHGGSEALQQYVGFGVLARALIELQRCTLAMPDFLLNDKLAFSRWCNNNAIASPPQRVVPSNGDWQVQELAELGEHLMVKPRSAFGGTGIELWQRLQKDVWQSQIESFSSAQFESKLNQMARQWPPGLVVQARLTNDHQLPYFGQALSTCRIVTMLNETGAPEIVEAYQRVVHDPSAIIDNFTAGGTFWLVDDFERGVIAYGGSKASKATQTLLGQDPKYSELAVGNRLPGWQELAEFALAIHTKAPRTLSVGWDIALTADGPVLIEANFPPSLTTLWQYSCDGFANSRLAQLYQHWLSQVTNKP